MSKNSATENTLGSLHSKVAAVFQKVLARYESRLDALDALPDMHDIGEEVLAALMDDAAIPNPAMMSAITKFLKDNEISFDSQEITELNDQERRLAERREKRKGIATLTTLSLVANG